MKRENLENPCCPRCGKHLKKNGILKTKQHIRMRYRCRCGYSECDDSIAHNSNIRGHFGFTYMKRSELKKLQCSGVSKPSLQPQTDTQKTLPTYI